MAKKFPSPKALFRRARRAHAALSRARCTTLAGTLAFFLVTAALPFLFWLTLLAGRIPGGDELTSMGLFSWAGELFSYFGEHAREASAGADLLFLATTLWSSSSFFYHLRRSGEIVYAYRREKRGWKVRLSSLVVTFFVLFYFAFAGAALLAAAGLGRILPLWLFRLTEYALVFVLGFFAAWILNGYICPYKVPASATAAGSALTAVLWLAASAVFSLYVRFADTGRLYGALSVAVAVLVFADWMAVCLMAGVTLNRTRIETGRLAHKRL